MQSLPLPAINGQGIDSPSALASETSSFQRREAELQTIEKRFTASTLRPGPSTRLSSRFREDFGEADMHTASHGAAFLSRLHLTMSRRARPPPKAFGEPDDRGGQKGASDLSSRFSVAKSNESGHKRDIVRRDSARQHTSESARQDNVEELWHRAIRTEMCRRSTDMASRHGYHAAKPPSGEHSPASEADQHVGLPASSHASEGSRAPGHPGFHSSQLFPKSRKAHRQEDGAGSQEASDIPSQILDEWAAQLGRQEFQAETRSWTILNSKPANRLAEIPESWARYPSHTRVARSGSANLTDNVFARDFAIKSVSEEGAIEWRTQKRGGNLSEPQLTARTLSNKVGKAIKTGLGRLVSGKQDIPNEGRGGGAKEGRRSSSQLGDNLEYPELELLPNAAGYKELRHIERDISELKGIEGLSRPAPSHQVATRSDNTGFSSEVAPVRRLGVSAHEDSTLKRCATYPQRTNVTGLDYVPVTPAGKGILQLRLGRGTTDSVATTSDAYATPPSRMTVYKDAISCTHSTTDDDTDTGADGESAKSDATMPVTARPGTLPSLGSLPVTHTKFMTWSGRTKTQPVLMQSTIEFGVELEKMLREERQRAQSLAYG